MTITLDSSGQPKKAYRNQENIDKALNTLTGICAGVLADGELTDVEIVFLKNWLDRHLFLRDIWPASKVVIAIELALEDGYISEDEREGLFSLIGKIVGGGFQETDEASGNSNMLPIEESVVVIGPGKHFCLTGKFGFGSRSQVQEQIVEIGGSVQKNVVKVLDYLVIGDKASRDWINTSHGRKIEKAVAYKEDGLKINIISEQQLVKMFK